MTALNNCRVNDKDQKFLYLFISHPEYLKFNFFRCSLNKNTIASDSNPGIPSNYQYGTNGDGKILYCPQLKSIMKSMLSLTAKNIRNLILY